MVDSRRFTGMPSPLLTWEKAALRRIGIGYNGGNGGWRWPTRITKDPNILGGEPVFRGTRVPFKILMEYLEGGDTLHQFVEQYPTVSRELAIAGLEEAKVSLVSQLR